MIDYLKNICVKNYIMLIYTNNKYSLLSSGLHNHIPIIRAQKIFRYCPEKIAKAIVYYYIGNDNDNKYLEMIKEYISGVLDLKEYKVAAPELSFLNCFNKNTNIQNKKNSSIVETKISSITLHDFKGKSKNIKPEDAIKVFEDNVTELDIVINPDKADNILKI